MKSSLNSRWSYQNPREKELSHGGGNVLELLSHARVSRTSILLLLTSITALVVLMLFIAIESSGRLFSPNKLVIITFVANGSLGVFMLLVTASKSPFSLCQIHWLFYTCMFVIAPFSQYLYGYNTWGYMLSADDYLVTNSVLTVWGIVFVVFSTPINSFSQASENSKEDLFFSALPAVSTHAAIVVAIISAASTAAVVAVVGLSNMFSRGTYMTELDTTSGLIFNKVLRCVPVFCLLVQIVRANQRRRIGPLLIFSLLLALVCDFPTAMARYNAAALYGGLALVSFRPLREKHGLFTTLFLLAFLVVFPAANTYRFSALDAGDFLGAIRQSARNLPQGFCAVDYDAYSFLLRTYRYYSENGATPVHFLSALLFFIPRVLWPNKSHGSGYDVALSQGNSQTNVSCPLPAEGIISFGIIGMLCFAAIAAHLCSTFDQKCKGPNAGLLKLFYPFACFMFFFMMRGDLLSSWAFSCGLLASFVIAWFPVILFSSLSPRF